MFIQWLLYGLNAKYKTIAFAHNGGRYDMHFIFAHIYNLGGLQPDVIKHGNKLYELKVEKKGIITPTTFHDSYNFIPLPLSKLVKTFDLNIQEKLYFPHLYNKESNYGFKRKTLPPKEDYLDYQMLPTVKEKFDKWYEIQCTQEFDLCEKLAEYCCSVIFIHFLR